MTRNHIGTVRWSAALALAALIASAAPVQTSAQGLYRCEAAGSVSYADRPCPHGTAAELQKPARPSPQQVASAKELAQREDTRAKQMSAERQIRAKHSSPGLVSGIRHTAIGLPAAEKDSTARSDAPRNRVSAKKDPRVTFEIKAPAAPRKAPKKVAQQRA